MRVFLFIPSLLGGAEKVSVLYSKILKENGYDVHNVILDRGKPSLLLSYLSKDIPNIYIKCKHVWLILPQICRIFKKENPDIVFSSLTLVSFFLIIAKFVTKSKVKIIYRHCFKPGSESLFIHYIIKFFFSVIDLNIAQTEEMKSGILKHYNLSPNKVITINNPLDEDDIRNKIKNIKILPEVSNKFIAIGRVSPVKDYKTMITAFSKVIEKIPNATLSIFGTYYDLEYKKDLDNLILELSMSNNVFFRGATDNPFEELLSSDVFVMSSVSEGLPNALIEAMYLNMPVAVTNCIPFIDCKVHNGENGYKANVGDSDALSKAMLNALKLKGKIKNENENYKIKQEIISAFLNVYNK